MKIDDKLARLGFGKVYEDVRRVHYERYEPIHDFYHTVVIEYRHAWQEFRLQSYDEKLFDKKGIGNTNVALSGKELKLFLKKLNQKELAYAKHRMWI